MTAPIFNELNSRVIPQLVKAASVHKTSSYGYIMLRLKGSISTIFEDGLEKNLSDAKEKGMRQIEDAHE